MSNLRLDNATASDMTNRITDYAVETKNVDSTQDQDETEWMNTNWTKHWGYFNSIAELKAAVIAKATWVVGKGYECDAETKIILDHISGWGKDTFLDVLFDAEVVKRVGGDSFCEIIRDEKTNLIINLKPLDPGSIKIIVGRDGRIKRYEQVNRLDKNKNVKFEPKDIFHLSNNRLASQIHGISDIDAIDKIILADQENFEDVKKIMHRGARPMILWKLKTDDQTKINAFVKKIDAARNLGEDMFIPDDEDIVSHEVVQIDVANSIMAWRDDMRNKFYRALGLPQVIFGSSTGTESGSKVEYLAHEQIFKKDQLHLEEQIWNQLNLKIKLIPPTTLLDNLQTDENKDANQQLGFMPSDMTAEKGGK